MKQKFRAWDGKKIHHNVVVIDGEAYKRHSFATMVSAGSFLMQFTGIQDKNGVDIYGADKYRWLGWEVRNGKQIRPERIYTVRDDTPEHWIEDCYKLWCISTGDSRDTVEVVGNIYENGEVEI